jgi:hypothetical protein
LRFSTGAKICAGTKKGPLPFRARPFFTNEYDKTTDPGATTASRFRASCPSSLPLLLPFCFSFFVRQDLGVALHVNDCNPEAKKTESQVFLLRYQNKELVSTSNVDSRMFHR